MAVLLAVRLIVRRELCVMSDGEVREKVLLK
jgi:hypothetical protein